MSDINVELADPSTYEMIQIAEIFQRSFENYLVPMTMDEPALKGMIYRDGIQLNLSAIILVEGKAQGLILISNRGSTDRIAAMGIAVDYRRQGVGRIALSKIKAKSVEMGRERMVLEVIGRNNVAIKLYERLGFEKIRRLLKLELNSQVQTLTNISPYPDYKLQPCSLHDISEVISSCGCENLPWQVDSVTLPRTGTSGFRFMDAFCAVSDPNSDIINFRSFIVRKKSRGKGQGRALMNALLDRFPNKIWRLNAIFPEEVAPFFQKLGFVVEDLFQYQMELHMK